MLFSAELVDEPRRKKALSGELTPIDKNYADQIFSFVGSEGGIYTTTLDECTCADFAIQGGVKPCKHMIRMAMELGLYPNAGMVSDPEAANAKYYLGILRQFVHEANLIRAVEAVQLINNLSIKDDAALSFAGIPSLQGSGLFTVQGKKQMIVPTKNAKKDLDGIKKSLINRLGSLLYDNLSYQPIMDLIRNFSAYEGDSL
nr:hypothetical protein [Clostridia bacterium]